VKRAAALVEAEAAKLIPTVSSLIMQSFYNLSQSMELAFTLDSADLMKSLGHVTAGIKLINHHTHDPITGAPLFLHDLGGNLLDGLQSQDACFPFKLIMVKDTAQLYNTAFQDFFAFF